jgi:RNA polymerase sigma-70 factor (ECF subfamily)
MDGCSRHHPSGSLPVPNDEHVTWSKHVAGRRSLMSVLRPRGRHAEPVQIDDAVGALLVRAGRGDQGAFAELFDQLSPMVHGVVRKVVRDPAISDEVTQEVFVELWRLAARFDGTKGSARSWASTLAHRRAIDRVRSEQSSRNRQDRDAAQTATPHDSVASEVEASLDQARVRRALAQLSELQREAVELAYFGGHTYREVAVLLGVAEGTVKSRIRDGLIRLRDELGGEA